MPKHRKITKAVIPAAGFGTRMLPATKALPKEMLPVAGKPLIQYAIEEAAASGIETVILVVRNSRSLIESHFAVDADLDSFLRERHLTEATEDLRILADKVEMLYVEQQRPLGLAHAICCASHLLGDDAFAVLLPDVIMVADEPVTRQLLEAHNRHEGSIVATRQVEPRDVERHGIVQTEQSSRSGTVRVNRLVEKPKLVTAPSNIGVFGRYILDGPVWEAIEQTRPDSRGEVQLTESLNLLCTTSSVHGHFFDGQHFDAGDRLGYLKANVELSLTDPRLCGPFRDFLMQLTR